MRINSGDTILISPRFQCGVPLFPGRCKPCLTVPSSPAGFSPSGAASCYARIIFLRLASHFGKYLATKLSNASELAGSSA